MTPTMRGRWTVFLPWFVVAVQCILLTMFLVEDTHWWSTDRLGSGTRWLVGEGSMVSNSRLQQCLQEQAMAEEDAALVELVRSVAKQLASSQDINTILQTNTGPGRVFYNRVPKCGSSSLMDLILELTQVNNFTFYRATEYMRFWLDESWQRKYVERVKKTSTPMVFERHFHFLDFRRYGMKQPAMINVIRDPLERLVSWYYFRRYQVGHIREMPLTQKIRTYDECVLGNHSECILPMGDVPEEGYFKIVPFFCGQEAFCREPTELALIQAIKNVKQHYTVVGTIENFPDFVEVLEALLPHYFTGATHIFEVLEEKLRRKHKTTYKLPIVPEVQKIMRQKLKIEYQFYYFIKHRFARTLDAVRQQRRDTSR